MRRDLALLVFVFRTVLHHASKFHIVELSVLDWSVAEKLVHLKTRNIPINITCSSVYRSPIVVNSSLSRSSLIFPLLSSSKQLKAFRIT